MYSGTTLPAFKYIDAWLGAHQKIDRVARNHLAAVFEGRGYYFPSSRQILKFEGIGGPDAIKRKAPGRAEPRHYFNPQDPDDTELIAVIEAHYKELVRSLRSSDSVRAAFDAAWLAHALVDGLTPAHHHSYEAELGKLRGGNPTETRDSIRKKLFIPGEDFTKRVHNNWKMWGDRGLLSTHLAFEWGIAAIIVPLRLRRALPTPAELVHFRQAGVAELFKERAAQISQLHMYEVFYKTGWTPRLAKQTRTVLVPLIINAVTLAWYSAVLESQQAAALHRKRTRA